MYNIIMNVLGFIAMGIFFISSFIKNKKKFLGVQSIAHVFLIITEAMAKTISSIVQEIISIIRNQITIFGKNRKWLDITLVLSGALIGIGFNVFLDGPKVGYNYKFWCFFLPIIANIEYSICILSPKVNERFLKLSLCISNWMWGGYFLACGIWTSGIINCISGFAALFAFFMFDRLGAKKSTIVEEMSATDNEVLAKEEVIDEIPFEDVATQVEEEKPTID